MGPRVRRSSALLALGVVLLALAGVGAPGAAAAPAAPPAAAPSATTDALAPSSRTTATPTPATPDGLPVRVQITQVTPTVLRPGEDLVVRARLTNTSTEEIADPRALVHLERIRPGTRADLQTWLDEPADGNRIGKRLAVTAAEAPLAPGAAVDLEVVVPADAVGLLDRPDTWGARGLAVIAADGNRRVGVQRTFALWATEGDQVAQARVSVLAPVVGPAAVPEDSDAVAPGATLAELVQPGERLGTTLDIARANPDVSLVVDPALLARARAGNGAVAAWADAVDAAAVGRDVVGLPWSDPDLAALAHGGGDSLLAAGVQASEDAATQAVDGGRPLAARTDVLWVAGPATDESVVDLAARGGASVLVLSPDDLRSAGGGAGARRVLTSSVGPLVGLVPDATLTDLLADPTSLDPDATTATVVQRVLAELSVLARGSSRGLQHALVALPRDANPDAGTVEAVLAAVQGAPWSRTAPLTALLGASGDVVDTPDRLPATTVDAAALAPAEVERLVAARSATVAFAAVTDEPGSLLRGVDDAALAPVAAAWRDDPTGRLDLVDEVVAQIDARRTGLTLARTSTQNLISADSEVRFSVRNDLPVAASVRVATVPRKPCLRTEPSAVVVVPPGGEKTLPVAVHAIANCEVVVEALLTGQDGAALADPVTFVVRASPTIESVGTAVVGVLLAVGLVLGVVRTVRRGQSARRGARRMHEDEGTRPLPVLGGTPGADA